MTLEVRISAQPGLTTGFLALAAGATSARKHRTCQVGTIALLALGLLAGCETLSAIDQTLYEAVPMHPVTGKPVANLVSKEQEVATAQGAWRALQPQAIAEGVTIDPAGGRLDQIQRVFGSLVAVAHRKQLPWEVHLIDHEMPNAMTPGGGMVWIFSGIFTDYPHGQGFLAPTDEEIAAVLAHEIAHVALIHVSKRSTAGMFTKRDARDPYYTAAYTTEQEAEADRLSVLYMALAGFDPTASVRIWRRAHEKYGSDPGLFLFDHPLPADRLAANAQAASQVMQYFTPGQQNPDWSRVLADNLLFPRTETPTYSAGMGAVGAATATLDAVTEHEQAKAEAKQREALAETSQARLVRVVATRAGFDAAGNAFIYTQIQNASAMNVKRLAVVVLYGGGGRWLAQDPNCGGPAMIPAGQTIWLTCPARAVPGASQFVVQLGAVDFD